MRVMKIYLRLAMTGILSSALIACGGGGGSDSGGSGGGGGTPTPKPTAANLTLTLDEDNSEVVTLQGTAASGGSLSYSISVQPTNGTVQLSGNQVLYVPNADYAGSDSFGYIAVEGGVFSSTATVSITVNQVNDAPRTEVGEFTMQEDGSLDGSLTASDVEGDTITFAISQQPAFGTVSIDGSNFNYQPDQNAYGTDVFYFTATDGQDTSVATPVSIVVEGVNDAPVIAAQTDPVEVVAGGSYTYTTNAADIEGDTLTYTGSTNADGISLQYADTNSAQADLTIPDGLYGIQYVDFSVTDANNATTDGQLALDVLVRASAAQGAVTSYAATADIDAADVVEFGEAFVVLGHTDKNLGNPTAFSPRQHYILSFDKAGNATNVTYIDTQGAVTQDSSMQVVDNNLNLLFTYQRGSELYARHLVLNSDLVISSNQEIQLPFAVTRDSRSASVTYLDGEGYFVLANDNQVHQIDVAGVLQNSWAPASPLASSVRQYYILDTRAVGNEIVLTGGIIACTDDPQDCQAGAGDGSYRLALDTSASSYQVVKLNDNDPRDAVIMADGSVASYQANDTQHQLTLLDASGASVWAENYDLPFAALTLNADEEIVMIAAERGNGSTGAVSAQVARYNLAGEVQWQSNLSIPHDGIFFQRGMFVDELNNIYLAAVVEYADSTTDYVALRVDYSGDLAWTEVNPADNPQALDNDFVFNFTGKTLLSSDNQIVSAARHRLPAQARGYLIRTMITQQ